MKVDGYNMRNTHSFFMCMSEDNNQLKLLEEKIKTLEKTLETTESSLTALRCNLNRPIQAFDRFEALDLTQALVRLARTKVDQYAATLDGIRPRWDVLNSKETEMLNLMLGLLGDPIRAKIAKEATSILNSSSKMPQHMRTTAPRSRAGSFSPNPKFSALIVAVLDSTPGLAGPLKA